MNDEFLTAEQRLAQLAGKYGLSGNQIPNRTSKLTDPKPYTPNFRMVNNNLPVPYQAPQAKPSSFADKANSLLNKNISLKGVGSSLSNIPGVKQAAQFAKNNKLGVLGAGLGLYDVANTLTDDKLSAEQKFVKAGGDLGMLGLSFSPLAPGVVGGQMAAAGLNYLGDQAVAKGNAAATQISPQEQAKINQEAEQRKATLATLNQEKQANNDIGEAMAGGVANLQQISGGTGNIAANPEIAKGLEDLKYSDSYDINGNRLTHEQLNPNKGFVSPLTGRVIHTPGPMNTYSSPQDAERQRKVDANERKYNEELALRSNIYRLEDLVSKRRVAPQALIAAQQDLANYRQGQQQMGIANLKNLADAQALQKQQEQAMLLAQMNKQADLNKLMQEQAFKKEERQLNQPKLDAEIAKLQAEAASLAAPKYSVRKTDTGEEVLYDVKSGNPYLDSVAQKLSAPGVSDLLARANSGDQVANKAVLSIMKQLSESYKPKQ
jgi:hypothetical protein